MRIISVDVRAAGNPGEREDIYVEIENNDTFAAKTRLVGLSDTPNLNIVASGGTDGVELQPGESIRLGVSFTMPSDNVTMRLLVQRQDYNPVEDYWYWLTEDDIYRTVYVTTPPPPPAGGVAVVDMAYA